MTDSSTGLHRRFAVGMLAIIAIACAPTVWSQTTADESDDSGLTLAFDLWWVAPTNLGTDFAFIDTGGQLSGGGDVQTLEYQQDAIPRFWIGWQFDAPGAPQLGALIWEYDATTTAETGYLPGQVGALLASPDFAIGNSAVDSAEAQSSVRALNAEILGGWTIAQPQRARLNLFAGIRWFRFQQSFGVDYRVEQFDRQFLENVTSSAEASGFGPLVRLRFEYGARFQFRGMLGLAAPVGEVESFARDAEFVDGVFNRSTEVGRSGTRRTFWSYELALLFAVRVTERWTVELGYETQVWSGVALTQRFVDELSQNTTVPVEEDIAFQGLRVGVQYRF